MAGLRPPLVAKTFGDWRFITSRVAFRHRTFLRKSKGAAEFWRSPNMAFFDALIDQIAATGQPSEEVWFRGHADASWLLLPRILRKPLRPEEERNLLARFRHRAMGVVADHPADSDAARWLFLMQHHGLPTRLLDWSESALTALYFAVASHPHSDGQLFILVPMALNEWQLSQRVLFPPKCSPCDEMFLASFQGADQPSQTIAIHAYMSNERISRQHGAFTVHGSTDDIQLSASHEILRSMTIPAADKPRIREQLRFLGVSRASLFNDLDSLANELREQHGF